MAATCQWLLVGGKVERRLALRTAVINQQFHRWSLMLIGAVVIGMLILAPVINQRSRSLGFRHGGISFR
jgi:hypothetical protein